MKRLFALLAPAAMLAPLLAGQMAERAEAQDAAPVRPGQSLVLPSTMLGFDPESAAPFDTLERARQPLRRNQVRIRQRVVIRVGPAAPEARTQMLADLPRRPMRNSYAEVNHGDCIDAEAVIGVQPTSDNRLLFFTSSDQIIAAQLANGCSARAFYAGFYIERSDDARLCVSRDRLQSRAGASCQVADFTRLVAVAN
jgi:hypothetical protein